MQSPGNFHLQKGRSATVEALFYVCFAIVVFFLYSKTFQSPIIFDDWYHIEANPHIQISSLSWDAIKAAAFESPLKHRPVPYITLALNYYYDGFNLAGYHLFNILIHLAAGIFLYMFLKTTVLLQRGEKEAVTVCWLSFTAVMIWLVHPLHIQSVTYIIQRMNSMAAMFYILSLLLYVRGRLVKGHVKQSVLFLGSLFSGLLALGSKENAATLPFFILLYEWYFFQDLRLDWLRKRLLPILGVLFLLACIAIFFLGLHPLASIMKGYGSRDFTMEQRVLTEIRVVLFYISLLFLPYPARLNLDHDFNLSLSLLNPPATFLSLCVLAGLFCLAIILGKRERIVSFSILWFLGNLIIESSVIGLEIIFEHRTYLPSMLPVLALVMTGSRIPAKRWMQVLAATLIVLLFSAWTYQRNLVWQDEVTLRRDAAAKAPVKPRALAILANALERKGQFEEAAYYYNETLNLNPRNADEIHFNLGNVYVAQRKLPEAVLHFREAVSLSPETAIMRLNLANALSVQGQFYEAYKELKELIRQHPEEPRAHNNLGVLLMQQGRFEEAALQFSQALKLVPNYRNARINLEIALRNLQKKTSQQ
ncbi:tetratricopeptide repeat protein [Thermodesulfobacteriota bacterium]